MIKFLRLILFPFSFLYGLIIAIRNLSFDIGIIPSKKFDFPIIGVGNLSTGGTGKTPAVEKVLTILKEGDFKIGVISRGYGRSTKGFMEVNPEKSLAIEIGDEPLQMAKKFPDVIFAVCEKRVLGVETLKKLYPNIGVVVLDDCFQHRYITPSLMILLDNYYYPFYKDKMLPSGYLREWRSGIKRADIILSTKRPIPENYYLELDGYCKQILKFTDCNNVFLSGIEYTHFLKSDKKNLSILDFQNTKIFGFSGLAYNNLFELFLREYFPFFCGFISFADHHNYSENDIEAIIVEASKANCTILITTEKDFRRLENSIAFKKASNSGFLVYYIEIELKILNSLAELKFKDLILNHVKGNQG